MLLKCFRAGSGHNNLLDDDRPAPPRLLTPTKRHSRMLSRQGSGGSTASTSSSKSNDSISKLPPCKRASDPKIESMMMPVPTEKRQSRCLRLSHPKIYSALVYDMKTCKGCRDWKNFPVFYPDDVDDTMSAEEAAHKKALDYQRKLKQMECSFASFDQTSRSISVDMIG